MKLKRSMKIRKSEESSENLASRLNELYRTFKQAYQITTEENRDIDTHKCREILEETKNLTKDPLTNRPETLALLSYMLLKTSKIPAILGVSGIKRGLKYQDRTLWDKALIEVGLDYLNRSAEGNSVSVYHLKAAVLACHSLAKDSKSTDWKHILSLYERYLEFNKSAEIALERAEVISHLRGKRGEIKAIEEIIGGYALDMEHELYEKLGNLHSRLHQYKEALTCFEKAYGKTQSKADKPKLKKKMQYCKMRLNYKKKYTLELSF